MVASANFYAQPTEKAALTSAPVLTAERKKSKAAHFAMSTASSKDALEQTALSADASLTVPMTLGNAPATSPAVLALRKINEALQHKTVSPQAGDCTAAAPNLTLNNEEVKRSIQKAEQLKTRLMDALKNDNSVEICSTVQDVERAGLCKDALEISRIGAVVNLLRKSVAESNPELSRQCRQLIKSWRSNVTEASRPTSSCSSSANGTPALVSPALRRGVTPRSGRTVTPGSVGADGIDGQSGANGYAPHVSPHAPVATLKRKSTVSPDMPAKKTKVDAAAPTPAQQRQQKGPSALSNSVAAARQNVQSTEQLVASLGMDGILDRFSLKKSADAVPLPVVQPPQPTTEKSKRGRKPKNVALAPQQQNGVSGPAAPPLKLKIRFGTPAARVDTDSAGSPIQTASSSSASSLNGSPALHLQPQNASTADSAAASLSSDKPHLIEPVVVAPTQKTPKVTWYDQLTSVEELERRAEEQAKLKQEVHKNTNPVVMKHGQRELIIMPYVELDDPDVFGFDGDLFTL